MTSMAVPVNIYCLAILGAYLALTAQADCGTDCTYCALQERFRKADVNPTMCLWQCEADFSGGSSWGPCRDLLLNPATAGIVAAAAIATANEGEDLGAANSESDQQQQQQESQTQQQLSKRYGGFMKRYGGFMKRYGGFMKRYGGFMKKSDETYGLQELLDDDVDHGREILTFRAERGGSDDSGARLDAINLLKELLSSRGVSVGAEKGDMVAAKRYGGFMRRSGGVTVQDALSGGARALQKRYGGFMRRVGWPEWLEESKRYGGFMRRSVPNAGEEAVGGGGEVAEEAKEEEGPEEQEPEMEKRYGGFMHY